MFNIILSRNVRKNDQIYYDVIMDLAPHHFLDLSLYQLKQFLINKSTEKRNSKGVIQI